MATVALGRDYTPTISLDDANGAPLAGVVSAGGTLSVYGPASATTVVATGTCTDKGYGRYGVAVAASVLGTAGWYRFSVPTITVGGITFLNQGGWFQVGDIPPEYRSYRYILQQVAVRLGLGKASTSTSLGSTTTLKDTRWNDTGLSTNEFVGDELIILAPAAATDANPVRVTTFDPTTGSTGTLTFRPAVAGAVASGTDYLLIRANAWGDRADQLRTEVDTIIADLSRRETATDWVTLTAAANTTDYALPANMLTIEAVEFDPQVAAQYHAWQEVAPVYWEHYPDRRLLHFTQPILDTGTPFRVTGKVGAPLPRAMADLVHVPATAVIDAASALLGAPPQQRAGLRLGRYGREALAAARW